MRKIAQIRQRGVSLIEALVAFAVMAFGMLAVVGMQATLRTNSDQARQRSEAVRIAQAQIEEWRSFSVVPTTTDKNAFNDITTQPSFSITGTNATYSVNLTAADETAVEGTIPAMRKTITAEVSWTDRNNVNQSVALSTVISGVEPVLEGSLLMGTNPSPIVMPRSRNLFIPPSAKNLGNGQSGFVPPGQSSTADSRVVWLFNNTTGVLQLCRTAATTTEGLTSIDTGTCARDNALLVSGYLRFDDSAVQPTTLSITNPTGTVPDLGLTIDAPAAPSAPSCFLDTTDPRTVPYYCAVPISTTTPKWTGRVFFTSPAMATATSSAPAVASLFKACKYSGVASSYTDQKTALANVNFIFIRAGNSTTVFTCPTPVSAFQP